MKKRDYPDNLVAYARNHFMATENVTTDEIKEPFESFFSDMKENGKNNDPRGANIVMDYFINGLTGDSIQEKYSLSKSRIYVIIRKYMRKFILTLNKVKSENLPIQEVSHKKTILEYNVSKRLYKILRGIYRCPDGTLKYDRYKYKGYPEDLIGLNKSQAMKLKGFGKVCWDELVKVLPEMGLNLNGYDLENPTIIKSEEEYKDEYPQKLL